MHCAHLDLLDGDVARPAAELLAAPEVVAGGQLLPRGGRRALARAGDEEEREHGDGGDQETGDNTRHLALQCTVLWLLYSFPCLSIPVPVPAGVMLTVHLLRWNIVSL